MGSPQHLSPAAAPTGFERAWTFVLAVAGGFLAGLAVFATMPRAAGLQAVVVESGSMQPSIRPGDVVVLAAPGDRRLGAGAVVTFRDAALDGRLVTHRVVERAADGTLRTQGDANRLPDSTPVPPAAVVGVAVAVVPRAGAAVLWSRSDPWRLVVLAVAGAALALNVGTSRRRAVRPAGASIPAGGVTSGRPAPSAGTVSGWDDAAAPMPLHPSLRPSRRTGGSGLR